MSAPTAKPFASGALASLAFKLVALPRANGHLCNVLTHISSDDWRAVDQAILMILEPRAPPEKLSKLARNMIELLCDDLGITGHMMQPFVFKAIGRIAGRAEMKRLEARIRRLHQCVSVDPPARLAYQRSSRPASIRRGAQHARVHRLPFIVASPRSANGVHP
jgi:hypothetical protein